MGTGVRSLLFAVVVLQAVCLLQAQPFQRDDKHSHKQENNGAPKLEPRQSRDASAAAPTELAPSQAMLLIPSGEAKARSSGTSNRLQSRQLPYPGPPSYSMPPPPTYAPPPPTYAPPPPTNAPPPPTYARPPPTYARPPPTYVPPPPTIAPPPPTIAPPPPTYAPPPPTYAPPPPTYAPPAPTYAPPTYAPPVYAPAPAVYYKPSVYAPSHPALGGILDVNILGRLPRVDFTDFKAFKDFHLNPQNEAYYKAPYKPSHAVTQPLYNPEIALPQLPKPEIGISYAPVPIEQPYIEPYTRNLSPLELANLRSILSSPNVVGRLLKDAPADILEKFLSVPSMMENLLGMIAEGQN